MSKVWRATIELGTLTVAYLNECKDWLSPFYKDINNPTEEEIRTFFEQRLESYSGSNDGSEFLANADITISCREE